MKYWSLGYVNNYITVFTIHRKKQIPILKSCGFESISSKSYNIVCLGSQNELELN